MFLATTEKGGKMRISQLSKVSWELAWGTILFVVISFGLT
jgi:hypothetical protein